MSAVAAGPDGLYFSDLYEDTGAGGATASGANIYRVRYVGNAGGQVPTVATPAAAVPNPVNLGNTSQLSVLGADDGGEMGVLHALFQPQRETNLRVRLDEYLRFGLHAGFFYAS